MKERKGKNQKKERKGKNQKMKKREKGKNLRIKKRKQREEKQRKERKMNIYSHFLIIKFNNLLYTTNTQLNCQLLNTTHL